MEVQLSPLHPYRVVRGPGRTGRAVGWAGPAVDTDSGDSLVTRLGDLGRKAVETWRQRS